MCLPATVGLRVSGISHVSCHLLASAPSHCVQFSGSAASPRLGHERIRRFPERLSGRPSLPGLDVLARSDLENERIFGIRRARASATADSCRRWSLLPPALYSQWICR